MKSRTSFFNKTAFKKDVTRFASLWGFYTLCMVLGMMLLTQGAGNGYSFQRDLASLPGPMNIINFGYAAVVVQLLFGDLYNSRMCNALHALPLRRESWFGTHVAAGLMFSLVPTLVGALVAAGLDAAGNSIVTASYQLPWLNLLAMNLQYLFFFALALFCAMCVGNRFAQLVVYGIINFASVIIFWLVDTFFAPMFYGIRLEPEPFATFAPVVYGADTEYFDMQVVYNDQHERVGAWFTLEMEGWTYTAICAVIGIALIVAALLLYRRRKLESAGDFMAVKALEPIFMVVFPLVSAGAVYFVTDGMLGVGGMVYLVIGMVIGYIAGRMLLERTTRVFSKKNILGFVALAVAFGAVCLTVKADPLGWEDWIPAVDEVEFVKVYAGYYTGGRSADMDTPEEIEKVLRVHEIGLNDRNVSDRAQEQYNRSIVDGEIAIAEKQVLVETVTVETVGEPLTTIRSEDYISPQGITLEYHLKNGDICKRYYVIDVCDEAGDLLIPYFSNMDMLFPSYLELPDTRPETIAAATVEVRVDDSWGVTHRIGSKDLILKLLQAVEADCEAGLMTQNHNFSTTPDRSNTFWIAFDMGDRSEQISCYTDCENINEFLVGLGIKHRYLMEEGDNTINH